ncbi:MAG: four helix bundle protein [Patescibacteria group bacterium]
MDNLNNLKVKNFTDLLVWKEAHRLSLQVYKLTKNFPKAEIYSLVDQMRRATVSIGSNIAEGFSRQSYAEKAQFYAIAQGSLTELQNQLLIARDVSYLTSEDFKTIWLQSETTNKLLNGLLRKTKEIRDN